MQRCKQDKSQPQAWGVPMDPKPEWTELKRKVFADLSPEWQARALSGELTLCGPYTWRRGILEFVGGVRVAELPEINTPKSFQIMPDIASYQAMGIDIATGKAPVITSRSKHREYLKRNGYIEVGNETPKFRDQRGDYNVRRELGQAVRQVINR